MSKTAELRARKLWHDDKLRYPIDGDLIEDFIPLMEKATVKILKAHAAETRREAEIERDGYRFDYEALQEEGYDFIKKLVASHKLLALEIEQLSNGGTK